MCERDQLMKRRIVRRPQVLEVTGLSRATVYRLIDQGLFPAPVKLGPNSVGWRESEILLWLESRERVDSHGAVANCGETGEAAGPAPSSEERTP